MSLDTFFSKIGHFFSDLFNAYDRVWNKIEPATKDILIAGSGIAQVIKETIDLSPDLVIEMINKKYPNVTVDQLKTVINTIAKDVDTSILVIDNNPVQTLGNLQAFLKTLKGTSWNSAIATLAQLLMMGLSSGGVSWEMVITLGEYIFQTFTKKQ